jgi:hypothetical protein
MMLTLDTEWDRERPSLYNEAGRLLREQQQAAERAAELDVQRELMAAIT